VIKNEAYVNNIVLKWARVTAKMDLSVAANKIKVPDSKLLAWENGDLYPTITQAKKLATIYRRPFAILFFPEIPKDFQPLTDYRKRNSRELTTGSIFIIREIQQKQIWIHDWMMDNKKSPLPFVGSCSANDSPKIVAEKIVDTFSLHKMKSEKYPTLKMYIDMLELCGVFVSRTSNYHTRLLLNPEEFLGFTISDIYAPYIFINTRNNWKKQQTFTLFHELAHLFIGESSISNSIDEISAKPSFFNDVEIFCNKVAANVLMPENELRKFNKGDFSNQEDIIL
jgi:DNA-binding XRE family transcriptional regulator